MSNSQIRQAMAMGAMGLLLACSALAQPARNATAPVKEFVTVEQPDAERTRNEFSQLLEHYPPSLKSVFALDPTLLSNDGYLTPYPALANYLKAHPEISRDPVFYVGRYDNRNRNEQDPNWYRMWQDLSIFAGFGMAIGLVTWLIRTLVDYRRWSRLERVQTDVHTKLLDRFAANEELLAYIKSPAGAKFLESSPITLDAGPRSVGAPLGRILWSVQAGVVLAAAGVGLMFVSGRVAAESVEAISALGILGIALGIGFLVSALISFGISHRLGLLEKVSHAPRMETPGLQGPG